jgi:hypothetical protein
MMCVLGSKGTKADCDNKSGIGLNGNAFLVVPSAVLRNRCGCATGGLKQNAFS